MAQKTKKQNGVENQNGVETKMQDCVENQGGVKIQIRIESVGLQATVWKWLILANSP